MGKNAHLHIVLETEFLNSLKKQARERMLSISELCRQKLYDSVQLDRIEMMLEKILYKNEQRIENKQDC